MTLALLAAASPAQALYKVVGPDGKVTYTDRPPVESTKVQPLGASGAPDASESLPFELRQIASRYPVTLYTTGNCQACDAGRVQLRQRGVPYSEKTVSTPEDVEAYTKLSGSSDLPLLQIGLQQLRGYSPGEWSSYLDAAGYPKQSSLPNTYQYAAASPLVAPKPTPAPQQAAASAPVAAAPRPAPPPPPAGNAPPGFKF
jgi:hypothetical protein